VQPPSKVEEPAAPRVIHEVAEKTALAVRAGKNRVEVVLDPPQLGRVHVQVATEAGRIQARIEATTEATRALLESRISQLTQAFEGAGLPVQGVSVSLHMDMNSQMLDQQPRGGTASYQHEDGRPAASEEAPDPARPNRSAVLGFSYLA
jgi:flagellar hook-length control protein FliK